MTGGAARAYRRTHEADHLPDTGLGLRPGAVHLGRDRPPVGVVHLARAIYLGGVHIRRSSVPLCEGDRVLRVAVRPQCGGGAVRMVAEKTVRVVLVELDEDEVLELDEEMQAQVTRPEGAGGRPRLWLDEDELRSLAESGVVDVPADALPELAS